MNLLLAEVTSVQDGLAQIGLDLTHGDNYKQSRWHQRRWLQGGRS